VAGILEAVGEHRKAEAERQPPEAKAGAARMPRFDVRVGTTPPAQWNEKVHAQLALAIVHQPPPFPPQVAVQIHYNEVDIRSQTAMNELQNVLNDYRGLLTRRSLEAMLPGQGPGGLAVDQVLRPIDVKTVSLASERQRGGWALAHIIPVILVLMTITGAIYPAIDLTAGERERGTLETVMVTPVPPLHLIVGKFLVVATIGMLTAALNVASVGATMHFSGITRALSAEMPVAFPLGVLPVVLLCLIPFALLFSAVLVAVCSFARTFKEAQNYIMPVMVLSMIPAMTSTFPTVRLERAMLVMPVGNMVLLARELLQGTYNWTQVAVVVLSTTLYAAAAIAVAAKLFGQEAVLFADSRSYRTMLARRFFVPADRPNASQALLVAALLFPASFYAQTLLADVTGEHFVSMMSRLAILQFLGLFVLVPVALCLYLKIDLKCTFRLLVPCARSVTAALLLGVSAWALANEFVQFQSRFMPASRALQELNRKLLEELARLPLPAAIVLMAVVPAVCEELFFRGFLLSGLRRSLGKWGAIAIAGLIFGVYHFLVDKLPITALLGILLGYVCWQTRSILPGMIVHALHNAISTVLPMVPRWPEWTGLNQVESVHLPLRIVLPAAALFITGLLLLPRRKPEPRAIFPALAAT
jgi:ABC-2 type transport system permease protein/sodium transport system permease protein